MSFLLVPVPATFDGINAILLRFYHTYRYHGTQRSLLIFNEYPTSLVPAAWFYQLGRKPDLSL